MSEWYFLDAEANHRSSLSVRSSPIAGKGLFATAPIGRNEAVGVWTGEQKSGDEWVDDHYGCELKYNDLTVVLTPVEGGVVNYSKHPFAAMNEPTSQKVGNIYSRVEEYDNDGDTLLMMVFYASTEIATDQELMWHYGATYDRDYAVGIPSPRVTVPSSSSTRFERMLINRPDGVVVVSEESKSDSSDSDYNP